MRVPVDKIQYVLHDRLAEERVVHVARLCSSARIRARTALHPRTVRHILSSTRNKAAHPSFRHVRCQANGDCPLVST